MKINDYDVVVELRVRHTYPVYGETADEAREKAIKMAKRAYEGKIIGDPKVIVTGLYVDEVRDGHSDRSYKHEPNTDIDDLKLVNDKLVKSLDIMFENRKNEVGIRDQLENLIASLLIDIESETGQLYTHPSKLESGVHIGRTIHCFEMIEAINKILKGSDGNE